VALSLSVPAFAKEFRSADVHPDDYPTVMAVKKMSDIIVRKDRRQGHHQGVRQQPRWARRRTPVEQVKLGALDMVRVNVAAFNNIVPRPIVPALPFLFKSKEHMRKCLDGPVGEQILAALESQGFIGLRLL
jgi:TRAP-type C4-dicarboxylate transport system substrate-binding protein